MHTGWTIAAAVAALGIGFGAGMATAPTSPDSGSAGTAVFGNAITLLEPSSVDASSDDPLRTALGLVSYPSYSDTRERLAELWEDLVRPGRGATRGLLEHERLLDELEQILALASEAELVEFIAGRRFSRDTVAVAEIAYAALANLSPERAAGVWRAESDETTAYPCLKVVMREWVQRDRAAAGRWVERLQAEEEAQIPRDVFLTVSAKVAPGKVVAGLDGHASLPPGAAMYLGESLPLEELGETADRLLAARADGSSLADALPYLLSSWGARDPLAATSWFLSKDLGGFDERQVVLALERAALREPSEVLRLLGPVLSDRPELREVAGPAWWTWVSQDGNETAGIEWIAQHAEEAAQFAGVHTLELYAKHEDWTPERVDRILAAFRNLDTSPSLDRFAQSFFRQLSRFQPEVALQHAVELLPPGSESNQAIAQAVTNWSMKEPEAALRWSLENFEGDDGRYSAIQFSVTHWASRDAKAAAEFAMGLEERDRRPALSGLGDSWARNDAEAVLAFLAEAADPNAMAPMANSAFRHFGQRRSGEVFFARALELPEGTLRNSALSSLFGGWAGRDPSAALAAIAELPDGAMRDASIFGAIGSVAHRDPKWAMDLSTQISVPERREREMISRGREWMNASPQAAEAAIRANPAIPEPVKAQIFEANAP